jgi:ankyrin repeat protein
MRGGFLVLAIIATVIAATAHAQVPPSTEEIGRYTGLHAAAAAGDIAAIAAELARGAAVDVRDGRQRTPLHVATFRKHPEAVRALAKAGADLKAFEHQRYDVVTIAAVADDVAMLRLVLDLGGDAKLVTSPYQGTALIAAAHLGHDEVVRMLIAAGAPLDHVNNLGWTALIEAIVLGDGGARHQACVKALIDAKANPNIADRDGKTPLALAKSRGYAAMAAMIAAAGGR